MTFCKCWGTNPCLSFVNDYELLYKGSVVSKTPLALLVLFFFSGACSLVYQVVWVRMLMPVFGVSTFAVSIVLAAFMAGLALGSYWCGRVADRRGNGLRLYALLELGIGVFALVFPLLLARA